MVPVVFFLREESGRKRRSNCVAAGCFVAAEAGATVTDLDTDYKWGLQTRAGLIASSQAVHDELHNLVDESKIGRLG